MNFFHFIRTKTLKYHGNKNMMILNFIGFIIIFLMFNNSKTELIIYNLMFFSVNYLFLGKKLSLSEKVKLLLKNKKDNDLWISLNKDLRIKILNELIISTQKQNKTSLIMIDVDTETKLKLIHLFYEEAELAHNKTIKDFKILLDTITKISHIN